MPVLLRVEGLETQFLTRAGTVYAVDGVSFECDAGEILGIVGESGSGKSVACLSLLGLVPSPPGRIAGGRALFDGRDLLRLTQAELRAVRGREIAMVFQDPLTALNPYMTIGDQVAEGLRVHGQASRGEGHRRAAEALDRVGIPEARARLGAYPHEFSGGMRQRVMMAMALALRPRLLIADEPTTALDVTVQAQILDCIRSLQAETGMGVLLITHDLGVVAETCRRVVVMYAGRILETAPVEQLFKTPRHPYTKALLESLPSTSARGGRLFAIPGRPPDLTQRFTGCPFAPRCRHAAPICAEAVELKEVAPGHATACVRVQEGESVF